MDNQTLVNVLTRIYQAISLWDQDPEWWMYSNWYKKCLLDVVFFLNVEIPEIE